MLVFAQRLKLARNARKLTQKELAHRAKIWANEISLFEGNKRTPSLENFSIIASTLGVSADYLLGKTDCCTLGYNTSISKAAEKLSLPEVELATAFIEMLYTHNRTKKEE